jgi:hypothetical protein
MARTAHSAMIKAGMAGTEDAGQRAGSSFMTTDDSSR